MSQKNSQALDREIEKLGQYVERNYKEITNPKRPAAISVCAAVFNALADGHPRMKKIVKAYDIEFNGWHPTLDKIVELTEARGSTAAQKIKDTVVKTKQMDKLFHDNQVKSALDKVRFAKQNPQ